MENLEQQKEVLYLRFNEIHKQLLELKQYELANSLSKVYHQSCIVEYKSGIEFIKNLYDL
jgi:vacuolar-type H+-ATPase subunit D/Vma8